MKKSIANPLLSISQVASSSNASSVLMGGLGGPREKFKPPKVPFTSETVCIGEFDCCLHTYDPDTKFSERPPKALIVYFHGANTHGAYPTTRLVADLMVHNGYAFVAPDCPGHGRSSGLRGYVESEKLINFGVGLVDHAYNAYLAKIASEKAASPAMATPGLRIFLIGSSMGGNLSLQIALRRKDLPIAGVVLLAPMLQISSVTPLTKFFIKHYFGIRPLTQAVPQPRHPNYRDPKIKEECDKDLLKPYQDGELVKLGTVKSLVEMTESLELQYENVRCPCLVLVGDEDKTVNNQGAVEFVKRAGSKDVTLKRYPALHGLMGEPSPLVDRIQADMIRWMEERNDKEYFIRSSL